jgi:hypothetical protein
MSKVIFLDCHGVLEINDKPSPSAYKNLASLLKKVPDLNIVISSSLRHKGPKYVRELLGKYEIEEDRVIGVTDLTTVDDRGKHIERWLSTNEVDGFVIFDDHRDMDLVKDHLVQTNPFIGLTSKECKKALDILKKPV